MERNQDSRNAWDFVEHTGISVFLTGKAGTGKTPSFVPSKNIAQREVLSLLQQVLQQSMQEE